MNMTTFEATVQNGVIRLPESVKLPENSRVMVVVREKPDQPMVDVPSPRPANHEVAAKFEMAPSEGNSATESELSAVLAIIRRNHQVMRPKEGKSGLEILREGREGEMYE